MDERELIINYLIKEILRMEESQFKLDNLDEDDMAYNVFLSDELMYHIYAYKQILNVIQTYDYLK